MDISTSEWLKVLAFTIGGTVSCLAMIPIANAAGRSAFARDWSAGLRVMLVTACGVVMGVVPSVIAGAAVAAILAPLWRLDQSLIMSVCAVFLSLLLSPLMVRYLVRRVEPYKERLSTKPSTE